MDMRVYSSRTFNKIGSADFLDIKADYNAHWSKQTSKIPSCRWRIQGSERQANNNCSCQEQSHSKQDRTQVPGISFSCFIATLNRNSPDGIKPRPSYRTMMRLSCINLSTY